MSNLNLPSCVCSQSDGSLYHEEAINGFRLSLKIWLKFRDNIFLDGNMVKGHFWNFLNDLQHIKSKQTRKSVRSPPLSIRNLPMSHNTYHTVNFTRTTCCCCRIIGILIINYTFFLQILTDDRFLRTPVATYQHYMRSSPRFMQCLANPARNSTGDMLLMVGNYWDRETMCYEFTGTSTLNLSFDATDQSNSMRAQTPMKLATLPWKVNILYQKSPFRSKMVL